MSGAYAATSRSGESGEVKRFAAKGANFAFAAAVSWEILGAESIVRPVQVNYRDLLWIIPFAFTAIACWYLHEVQRSRATSFERFSFYTLMAASALALVGNMGAYAAQPTLAALGFPLGAILWTLGLIAFGVATLKLRMLPPYVGVTLILLEPGSILTGLALAPVAPLRDHGAYSAGVEKGLAMAIVGIGLRWLQTRGLTQT